MQHRVVSLNFLEIAASAGYAADQGGKLNLPATQEVAQRLALAAVREAGLDTWQPGDPGAIVSITGPGPVWAYLAIAHELHGRAVQLIYRAPNADLVIWSHGVS